MIKYRNRIYYVYKNKKIEFTTKQKLYSVYALCGICIKFLEYYESKSEQNIVAN